MHDIRMIREDPDGFDRSLVRRGVPARAIELNSNDARKRFTIAELQKFQAERNELAKRIGLLKRQGADTKTEENRAVHVRDIISDLEKATAREDADLVKLLSSLPNRLADSVPDGLDDVSNVEEKHWGNKRSFGFDQKQHFELGEALGMMDFESASRIAGARFTVLRGGIAHLERALGQYMIDAHLLSGYEEISPPGLVNSATLFGTGQLPKFAEDCFRTKDERWLIPTAEVPLTNLAAGQVLLPSALPLRFVALTDCYRSEAGSAGRDTRGMLRQHQFRKVELVSITAPEDSEDEHERMTRCAERVLERLDLPYRRMLLCAGETGFSAAKTYDLEVWLPGQEAWREISSCSNCRDFQARRMNARMRDADGKTIRHVHTLNGSGVAVGRALIAVMENYQNADGSIAIPEVLRERYMNGMDALRRA